MANAIGSAGSKGVAETRRVLLTSIISNDAIIKTSLQSAFSAFGLAFTRAPLLTYSLKFEELNAELYTLMTTEINSFLSNCLVNKRHEGYEEKVRASGRRTSQGINQDTKPDADDVNNASGDNPLSGLEPFSTPWTLEDLGSNKPMTYIPEDNIYLMKIQVG